MEIHHEVKRIEGEIPRELHGTLFRIGPSQRILPEQGYRALHLFDGDGLIHAFRFDEGRIWYRSRFVESPSFEFEQSEGRFCMDTLGVKAPAPTDRMTRQQHNTNVVWHGGKLMAMVENAWPFRVDPKDLGPLGFEDFGGPRLGSSVSAHPKIDGRTGQMLIHGYGPFPPFAQLYVVEPDGRCSLAENIDDVPFGAMMHDFAITKSYVVLPVCPIRIDVERVLQGGSLAQALVWEPDRGLWFGVRRREPGSPMRWFRAPEAGYLFHPGNAYEDGDKIYMDACTYPDGAALLTTLATWRGGQPAHSNAAATPTLYEFDLTSGECRARAVDERTAEFPRIDDRLVGYRNRWGYAVRTSSGSEGRERGPYSALMKYDRTGGSSRIHEFGAWQFVGEPVFVPRAADSAEDDGYVLNVTYDGTRDLSYLTVLDAQNLSAAPLARVWLDHPIPQGFHGNFAAGVL